MPNPNDPAKRAPQDIERRYLPATLSEIRIGRKDGSPAHIEGYAALFNSNSEDLGGFVETIAPGAFTDALAATPDVRALFNHDPNNILARTKSGTLRVWEDAKGLAFDGELPDTQLARDLQVSMARGDVDQTSFAFSVARGGEEWTGLDGQTAMRRINAVERLYDVSVVTYPAYPETTVALRSLQEARAATETQSAVETRAATDTATGTETGAESSQEKAAPEPVEDRAAKAKENYQAMKAEWSEHIKRSLLREMRQS